MNSAPSIAFASFHRMLPTLAEITAREEALAREITERQRLIAAYRLIRADWEKSLAAGRSRLAYDEPEHEALPEPATPPVVPAPPAPVVPAVNLEALGKGYGGGIRIVTWAIRQMTGDFKVHDIAAILRDAGCPMPVAKVSVVLNRMKDEGKLKEVSTGRGRTPSVFRATDLVHARPLELAARHRKARPVKYRIFR